MRRASGTTRVAAVVVVVAGASCHDISRIAPVTGVGQIASIDFGRVVVGETVAAPFTVANVYGNTFHLSPDAGIAGADPGDFQIVTMPALTVQESQSVTGSVSFSPAAVGPRTGTLTMGTDNPASPSLTGNLAGVGVAPESLTLSVDPASLDFGQVEIQISSSLPLRITNSGVDPAPLQPFSITGTDAATFGVSIVGASGPPPTLAPGASLALQATFTPPTFGSKAASLAIQACRLCAPIVVPLSGIGFSPGLVFIPSPASFTAGRYQSQTKSLQLVNKGNATTTVTGFTFADGGGQFSTDYASKPVQLASGGSLMLNVTYAPLSTESVGTIDSTQIVPTTTGGDVQVSPGLLNGTVLLNCQISAPRSLFLGYADPPYADARGSLTLRNSGSDDCDVSGFAFVAGSDPAFALVQPAPVSLTVPGHGSTNLNLVFAPADSNPPAARAATLAMTSGEVGAPTLSVALSGVTQNTPFQQGSPWPKWCHDNGNSCLTDVDTSASGPTLQWRTLIGYPHEAAFGAGPAVAADGTLYAVGVDSNLYAVSSSGVVQWQAPAAGPNLYVVQSVPTIAADGHLAIAGLGGGGSLGSNPGYNQYYGFAPDGGELWGVPTLSTFISNNPLLRPDQTALMMIGAGTETPATSTGIVSYLQGVEQPPYFCPTCLGGGAMSADGTSYWYNGLGNILQMLSDGGMGYSVPVSFTCDGTTAPASDDTLHLQGTDLFVSSSFILQDGGIFAAVGAFDTASGLTLEWQLCLDNQFFFQIAALGADGGVILETQSVITQQSSWTPTSIGLAWIDPPGTIRWTNTVQDKPYGQWEIWPPAVSAEGTIYVTLASPTLTAYSGADGGLLWSFNLDGGVGGVSAPSIGADGTIYFQDEDGYLNAIR